MALKGNLRDFSIIQLLNLINLANKSGGLHIEGPSQSARIIFREGKLAFVILGEQTDPLLIVLQNGKLITPKQVATITSRGQNLNDKEMGIFLINAGYLTQQQIFSALETSTSEIVRKLFTWNEGFFNFEIGEITPDEKIPIRLDLENLIVEGARNLQELEDLKNELPSLEMALKFTERPGTNIRDVNLSVEEWRVVSYVNPKNTIQQIAKTTQLNELEIRRVVYALLQAGLVELVRPVGTPLALSGRMFKTQDPLEQKSLVNRLIERIRSI
jgi:hypothetical protein